MTYDRVQGGFDEILDVVQFPHLLEVLKSAEALIPKLLDAFTQVPVPLDPGVSPELPGYQEALEVAENNERFVRAFTPLVDAGVGHAAAARDFVAPWVERVESGGALSRDEVLRSMPSAKRARLNLALAIDVHRLVSTLAGQRTRYVKFLAGTATEEDRREAKEEWAVVFDRESHLSLAEYSPAVTGAALELKYRVEDDSGAHTFDYDGFADGHLQWVVAELDSHFPNARLVDPSQVVHTVGMEFLLSAARQVRASRGFPIRWCVQSQFDAQRLLNLLTTGGYTQITVEHVPAG